MAYPNIIILDRMCLSLIQKFKRKMKISCLIRPNLDDGSVHLEFSVGKFVES